MTKDQVLEKVEKYLNNKDNLNRYDINYTKNGIEIIENNYERFVDICHLWYERHTRFIYQENCAQFHIIKDFTFCIIGRKNNLRYGVAKRNENDNPDTIVGFVVAFARARGEDVCKMIGWE